VWLTDLEFIVLFIFYVYISIFYYLYIVCGLPTVLAYIEAICSLVVSLNLKSEFGQEA